MTLDWSNPRTQTAIWWSATALGAVLVAAGGFWLGRASFTPVSDLPSPTLTTTPTPVTSLAPGNYAWDDLLAGSCLETFPGSWEPTYDVVPCSQTHVAQVVRAGQVPGYSAADFPGEAQLQQTVLPLCTEPGLIDAATAATPGFRYTFVFPVTAADWRATEGAFVCFLSSP